MTVQTTQSNLLTLASWMAGEFNNWEQAIANPPFFAHIRLCIRPLPVPLLADSQGFWLYSEQAYDYEIHFPYRTAILHLTAQGDHLEIDNYRVKDAKAFFGASREPERLRSLTIDQVEQLDGCKMLISLTPQNTFKGAVEPGKRCCVVRNGKETYLFSEFEVAENSFTSLDRGHDPVTDERVWGSVAGAFEFTKTASFPIES